MKNLIFNSYYTLFVVGVKRNWPIEDLIKSPYLALKGIGAQVGAQNEKPDVLIIAVLLIKSSLFFSTSPHQSPVRCPDRSSDTSRIRLTSNGASRAVRAWRVLLFPAQFRRVEVTFQPVRGKYRKVREVHLAIVI